MRKSTAKEAILVARTLLKNVGTEFFVHFASKKMLNSFCSPT